MIAAGNYIAERSLATALFLALRMERPLFLEGEAGVGKTEIAKVVALSLGRRLVLEEQKAFFKRHIAAWAPVLFRDMEAAATSLLYARLGGIGRAFLEVEEGAFAMV